MRQAAHCQRLRLSMESGSRCDYQKNLQLALFGSVGRPAPSDRGCGRERRIVTPFISTYAVLNVSHWKVDALASAKSRSQNGLGQNGYGLLGMGGEGWEG